jgi:SOS-response transcriptional repressor LexA
MALKDRITEAIHASGKTPAEIARETKTTNAAVTHWMNGGTKSLRAASAEALERATGYSATWLVTGVGSKLVAANVEPGPDLKGLVPLISWIQAGSWHGAEDPLHPGEAETWMPSPTKCSPSSYALRVRGDSMTAPHGNIRSYPEGCIIFVDPERRLPVNGDRIVAKLRGTDEVTFKIYKNEDGRQWLQPLNPAHEPIREPFQVLGGVVGTWIPE